MLKMIDVKLIRDLKESKGKSLREIARITKYNFRTVKKYVEMEDFSEDPKVKKLKLPKLAPFHSIIGFWLEADKKYSIKQRHTAIRIHERLKEEYGAKYDASYSLLAEYVAKEKIRIYNNQGYLPLKHLPGSSQVDFGTAQYYENIVKYFA
jgi:transcriptional regulator with XRE-family HTH domain